jgi:hypothetical protein
MHDMVIMLNGWTVDRLPRGGDFPYSVTARTIHNQKLVFYFQNKRGAVSFCHDNPACGVVI